jgi:hypothetical protein
MAHRGKMAHEPANQKGVHVELLGNIGRLLFTTIVTSQSFKKTDLDTKLN